MAASAAALVAAALPASETLAQPSVPPAGVAEVTGTEHWTVKRAGADNVKLFMWRKRLTNPSATSTRRGTILFVHGSSVSATPVFDLRIPGKPEASTMDWFARLGYDTWCVDCEGYGHSDKWRPVNADVACGADDLAVASEYIMGQNGGQPLLMYGASSGALRAGLFAQRQPQRVQRLALDALVWTGEGSPTLAERKKRLAQYQASNRRPIDRAFVQSIFTRDHPGTSDLTVVDACRPCPRHIDAERDVHRHVRQAARARSEEDRGADVDHARRVRRHRLVPGPRQLLCVAAQLRQAVHRHAWDRAYQHALEKLGARLSPARRLLQPTAPGLRRLRTARGIEIAVMPWLRHDGLSGRRRSAMIDAYPLVGDCWQTPRSQDAPASKFCSWFGFTTRMGVHLGCLELPRKVPIAAATAHCAACCRLLDNERSRHV
jgi:pimeloyl-ACP methyl ester carboxylesterase